MFAFAGRDDDRIDLGMSNDGGIVGGVLRGADFLRQCGGFFGVLVGYRDEAYCRMSRRQLRAQAADTARADDGQTQCFAFDDPLRAAVVSAMRGVALRTAFIVGAAH